MFEGLRKLHDKAKNVKVISVEKGKLLQDAFVIKMAELKKRFVGLPQPREIKKTQSVPHSRQEITARLALKNLRQTPKSTQPLNQATPSNTSINLPERFNTEKQIKDLKLEIKSQISQLIREINVLAESLNKRVNTGLKAQDLNILTIQEIFNSRVNNIPNKLGQKYQRGLAIEEFGQEMIASLKSYKLELQKGNSPSIPKVLKQYNPNQYDTPIPTVIGSGI
jgi:hypothetical protein